MSRRPAMSTWVDRHAGADPEAHTAAVQEQHTASKRCNFSAGDRVRVLDFREDAHNFNGTVVATGESEHYGWYCVIDPDDGRPRVRKVTAKLKRISTPAPRRRAGPTAPARP